VKFVDLFAGLGGFHHALAALGHECIFVSELNDGLRELYAKNFPGTKKFIHGDIRQARKQVPPHDILAAGFPCQPFSKSGKQRGLADEVRGTLFAEVVKILRKHRPQFVILENVGNFERHDAGNTWRVVRESLERLRYNVRGTTHVASGGHGLISPHHLGFPQARERFFIVASTGPLPPDPFPSTQRTRITRLTDVVENTAGLSASDRNETALSAQQIACIDHWNAFVRTIPTTIDLPSFPLWGDEFGARYPFEDVPPAKAELPRLRQSIPHKQFGPNPGRDQLLSLLPAYANRSDEPFPRWKIQFIYHNRRYYRRVNHFLPSGWRDKLGKFPPSLRKLEWNCNGEKRDLWQCVLQFRPSGLRAKRYTSVPAMVAMTVTQIPILGPERRFLTRREGLRLQGFPDTHQLPKSRQNAFAALGNAVHTGVVLAIAHRLIYRNPHPMEFDLASSDKKAGVTSRAAQ